MENSCCLDFTGCGRRITSQTWSQKRRPASTTWCVNREATNAGKTSAPHNLRIWAATLNTSVSEMKRDHWKRQWTRLSGPKGMRSFGQVGQIGDVLSAAHFLPPSSRSDMPGERWGPTSGMNTGRDHIHSSRSTPSSVPSVKRKTMIEFQNLKFLCSVALNSLSLPSFMETPSIYLTQKLACIIGTRVWRGESDMIVQTFKVQSQESKIGFEGKKSLEFQLSGT